MDINLTQKLRQKMASRSRIRGRYSASEIYAINYGFREGKLTPEQWMRSPERSTKELLTMWSGTGMHNQIQGLLGGRDYKEEKVEFPYKDIIIVAKADFMPSHLPDEVWEFKTSEKLMKKAKPWAEHQVKLYTTMFKKKKGTIYQPVQDDDGIYLKDLGSVERDDEWFENEMRMLYDFHLRVEEVWKNMKIKT